jgi:hypothetical protein
MGGILSGTLANIFIGLMEQKVIDIFNKNILFYGRYADDVLCIFQGETTEVNNFLCQFRKSIGINILSTVHRAVSSFLDLCVSYSTVSGFSLSLFTKHYPILTLPLASDKRPLAQVQSIARSQFLRLWRASTSTILFSSQVQQIRYSFPLTGLNKVYEDLLREFLLPVKISQSLFLAQHYLCPRCMFITFTKSILLRKSMFIFPRFIASRMPISCELPNNSFLIFSPPQICILLVQSLSFHDLLNSSLLDPFSQILPLGSSDARKDFNLLKKSSLIWCKDSLSSTSHSFPPSLHFTAQKMSSAYGINSKKRATIRAESILNDFKKLTRKSTNE